MLWDSPDLLARCKRQAMEPDISVTTSDDDWYAFLTEAEAHWKPVIAAHYPGPMYLAPMPLLQGANNKTFMFIDPDNQIPTPIIPIGQVEVYSGPSGRLLIPGAYWDRGADYVTEGDTIRITNGRSMTFANGVPYARYVLPPGVIDANTSSGIKPDTLRILLVYRALYSWASRGGMQDPSFYRALEQKAAFGDPDIAGDVGLIGGLKLQNSAHGMAAYAHGYHGRWTHPV